MTDANKRRHIAAELERAEQSLRAGKLLLDADLFQDAESRLYYAVYHAAMALFLTEGIEPRSHTGLLSLLGLHFVKTGRLPPDDARFVARMQKYRIEADYNHSFVLMREGVLEDYDSCEGFLTRVRELVTSAGLAPNPSGAAG
jgi:uncharacterized protein